MQFVYLRDHVLIVFIDLPLNKHYSTILFSYERVNKHM